MPLKKIRDFKPPCTASDHNPPAYMYYTPGEYEWTCPRCGTVTRFYVAGPIYSIIRSEYIQGQSELSLGASLGEVGFA